MTLYDAFTDELQKLGWFGTYYHGTSPEAEKIILREGLKTSKNVYGPGAVYLTPSKSHARRYKQMSMPEMMDLVMSPGKASSPLISRIREGAGRLYRLATAQPLEIRGIPKRSLVKDPENPLFGKMYLGDVHSERIRKGTSRLSKILSLAGKTAKTRGRVAIGLGAAGAIGAGALALSRKKKAS